jgi:aminoglycoside/choline kinase family phosphotransferase
VIVVTVQDSSRQRFVIDWLARRYGWPVTRLEPASADASFRRYYRLKPGRDGLPDRLRVADGVVIAGPGSAPTVILMDAPPPAEDLQRFVTAAHRLRAMGLNVPVIHAADTDVGIALVADLGTHTYLDALEAGEAPQPLYAAAIEALVRLQRHGTPADAGGEDDAPGGAPGWPAYDEALLTRELGLFTEWYLQRHLGLTPPQIESGRMTDAFAPLIQSALAQPRVLVHRDYHSRNLMCTPPLPGVLDFQDAVIGPLTYDLVSLLRDCYVDVPAALESSLLAYYRERAARVGLALPSQAGFQRDFDWMGVQRHLKVLGIFARLWYRDGRADYLQYLPRVRRYLTDACAPYEELAPLGALIARLAPADAAAVERILRQQEQADAEQEDDRCER